MRILAASALFSAALLAGCSAAPAPQRAPPGREQAPASVAERAPPRPPMEAPMHWPPPPEQPPAPCDWAALALPWHRAMIEVDPRALLDGIVDRGGDTARLVALLERPIQPAGAITGAWRVRSLQHDGGATYAYPAFDARIDAHACGARFAKTGGSQRRSGVLYAIGDGPDRFAFLGAATIGDAPARDYDRARPAADQQPGDGNSAGVLYRIGPQELLMLLDAGGDGRFEVYHLQR